MRSSASTWINNMSYWPLLRSLLNQRKYQWYYSPPQLVNGGLAPPPSRFYPGTKCYMVILAINRVEYYGFGPTPNIAKHFATFEAYNSLHPLPSEEVEQFCSTIPAHVIESPNSSDSDHDTADPLCCDDSSIHPTDQRLNEASSKHSDKSSDVGSEKEAASDHETTDHECDPDGSQTPSVSVQEPSRHDNTINQYTLSDQSGVDCISPCLPHVIESSNRQFDFPNSHDELENRIQTLPSDYEPHHLVWVHDERVVNKKRDLFVDVDEIAQRKGVSVSYHFKKCGPSHSRAVMCIAKAAGFQFTGRHFEKPLFAKCESAIKLLAALTKLPDVTGQLSHTSQQSLSAIKSSVSQSPSVRQSLSPLLSPSAGLLSQCSIHQKCNPNNRNSSTTNSNPVSSNQIQQIPRLKQQLENTPSTCPLALISHNPIGQLQELMLKEHLNMPVYSERVNSFGAYTEYTCTVTAKGLSAKGVGCSKMLAKRHAAENLLALMHTKHMNIDPATAKKDAKKPRVKPFNHFRTTTFPPCHHYGACSPTEMGLLPHPLRSHEYPYQPPFGSSMYCQQSYTSGPGTPPTYCPRRPFPPGHVAQQPYCPPPDFTGRLLPPPTNKSPLLPLPHSYVSESDTETDSGSDCVEASSGLCEMIPFSAADQRMYNQINHRDEKRQNTSPASTKLTNVSPKLAKEQSPQDSGFLACEKRLSEIKSPFDAHSDPLHFMMRLPRERKEPWTNPATLGELDMNNLSTKPPWCKIRRNSSRSSPVCTPPRELVPPIQPQQKDKYPAEAHSERVACESNPDGDLPGQKSDVDVVILAPKNPAMHTGNTVVQDDIHSMISQVEKNCERCLSSEQYESPLQHDNSLSDNTEAGTGDLKNTAAVEGTVLDVQITMSLGQDNTETKSCNSRNQSPPLGDWNEVLSPVQGEMGVSPDHDGGGMSSYHGMSHIEQVTALYQDIEEHPLVKEYKGKGMTNIDHYNQNVDATSLECTRDSQSKRKRPKKKGPFIGHFTFMATQEYFEDMLNEEVHVCMPSEGTIATVTK